MLQVGENMDEAIIVQEFETKQNGDFRMSFDDVFTFIEIQTKKTLQLSWKGETLVAFTSRSQDDVSCGSHFLTRGGGCPMTACHVVALTANYMQVAANDWYEVADVAGWLANKGVTRVHGDKKLQSWQTRDPRILEALIANH
ncbi:hypothetical protein Tco_0156406 [Tanacetum coccineum]